MTEKPITIQEEILKPFWKEEELKELEEVKKRINIIDQINLSDINQAMNLIHREEISVRANQLFKDKDSPFEANEMITNNAILEAYTKGLIEEQVLKAFAKHIFDALIDHEILNYRSIWSVVKGRYSDSFSDNPERILTDIQKILDATDKEKYLDHIATYKRLAELEEGRENSPYLFLKRLSTEGYTTCYLFFQTQVSTQLTIVDLYKDKGLDENKAHELISKKVEEWYPRPKEYTPGRAIVDYEYDIKDYEVPGQAQLPTLPQLQKPDFLSIIMAKAYDKTFNRDIKPEDLQQVSLDISSPKSPTVAVNVDISPLDANLGADERATHDAVCSFALSGQYVFTARQIATFELYGDNKKNGRPSKKQVEARERRLENMSTTRAKIDATEHARALGLIGEGETLIIKNYILPLKEVIYTTANGKEQKAYMLIDNPPYLDYGKRTKELGQIPAEALAIPDISMTAENKRIRDYLLRAITSTANPKSKDWGENLTFDTIFERAEIDLPEDYNQRKKKRSEHIKNIKMMLTYWKEKGYINSFTIEKKKRQYHKIIMDINKASVPRNKR